MSQHIYGNECLVSFDVSEAKCVTAALGPMPRETLTAMVDCGLSDTEIGRYFKISKYSVIALRRHFKNEADQGGRTTILPCDTCSKR